MHKQLTAIALLLLLFGMMSSFALSAVAVNAAPGMVLLPLMRVRMGWL